MTIRPLTPELEKKAKEELGETPKKLTDSLQHLKDWIAKQPHLRARTDDQWLVAYLRGCKFSLERSKEKIDLTYTLRSVAPEMFTLKVTDPKFQEILKLGVTLPFPKLASPTDPRILLYRPGQYDPSKYSPLEVMSVGNTIMKIMQMEDDNMVIAGSVFVMDFKGSSMAHFSQIMTPVMMKKSVVAGQDATPVRMKGAHYVNSPPGFETLFNIVKTFLNEKNKQRLNVHGKGEGLQKFIPKEILPAEYGGDGGSLAEVTDYWIKKVKEYSSWLEEDEKYGTDESKRPGKPNTAEDMFGVEGSFRQLEFD